LFACNFNTIYSFNFKFSKPRVEKEIKNFSFKGGWFAKWVVWHAKLSTLMPFNNPFCYMQGQQILWWMNIDMMILTNANIIIIQQSMYGTLYFYSYIFIL